MDALKTSYAELQSRFNMGESQYTALYNENVKNLQSIANQTLEMKELRRKYDDLDKLSKNTEGAELTSCNASIADLSDENRPTKLAERFSELYDNEWTDAFEEVCDELDEQDGVHYMLKLVQRAFSMCQEIAKGFIEDLKRNATSIKYTTTKSIKENKSGGDANGNTEDMKAIEHTVEENQKMSTPVSLSADFLKQIFDMQKTIGLQMEELVIENITLTIAPEFDLELEQRTMTCANIRKCVQLCWSLRLKDPPVYMNIITPGRDTKFDNDLYKAYTKTGKRLLFVVWAPLYLHENGPLLSKGVAQGEGK